MFGISFSELVFLALVVLIVFGPEKLPEMGRTLGKLAREIKRAADPLRREFYNSIYRPAQDLGREIDRGLKTVKLEAATPFKAESKEQEKE